MRAGTATGLRVQVYERHWRNDSGLPDPIWCSPAPLPRLRRDTHALLRPPPPRPRLRRQATQTLLPAPPPRPRLHEGYPDTSPAAPTPPAPAALLPRPQRGAGAVRGDIRGTAVPGAMPGVQPCSGLLRDLPMCWTVGISPRGEGLTGRGNSFPLPCLPHSNHLTSRRHPLPAPPAGRLPILLSAPPPHPRLRRSSPAPKRGRGQCLRYQGSSRAREQRWKSFPERLGVASPYPAHPQDLPMHWIVVALCHWGRRPAGRGNASPLPCLSSPPPHSRLRPASGSGPWHTRHGDGLPG